MALLLRGPAAGRVRRRAPAAWTWTWTDGALTQAASAGCASVTCSLRLRQAACTVALVGCALIAAAARCEAAGQEADAPSAVGMSVPAACSEVAGFVAARLAAKGLSPHRVAASLRGSARSELSYGP
eukprot:COSAG02_NODE_14486_length_1267_cov_0.870719_1_plen_127_part_00